MGRTGKSFTIEAAGLPTEMLETFEDIKTPAINKSEVFGKLFGKLTIITMDMLTFKAIITCSKMPTRGRQMGGVLF